MKTLNVDLADRSYPIYIGTDLISAAQLYTPHISGRQTLIVTNQTVAPLYLKQVQSALAAFDCHSVILPDGEEYKNLQVVNQIYDQLLEKHLDRRCTLIALGGGVVGDMTGFAAATYQRGVNFIQVPTTLLAQVDSSVGGKTGVNHPLGKNMIGAFYQPKCVLADTNTLNTLEDRQLSAGIAEVIKYGLIRDQAFFHWLQQNMLKLLERDAVSLAYAIEVSCQNKADVVAADELEGGIRAILNLGHTFGHAIEAAMGYGNWLHGEAVATGMLMAAELSHKMQWLSADDVQATRAILQQARLPVSAPQEMDYATFMRYMQVDKKVEAGVIRLILLKSIGEAMITADYSQQDLQQTIEEFIR